MQYKALMTLLVLTVLATGCAKKKSSGAPPAVAPAGPNFNNGPFVPPSGGTNWAQGGTATLVIDGATLSDRNRLMGQYTGRSMNDPKNIQLNLNLSQIGSGYGGITTIRYDDNGFTYEGYFTSGDTAHSNQYNIWFSYGGKTVWHGFFEDFKGGLIVVIDETINLGDGGGVLDKVNGSVWFKNFAPTYAPHPPSYCWFVSLGPYDCRSWQSGNGVSTTLSVNPTAGYVRLGKFSNMSVHDAFNGSVDW